MKLLVIVAVSILPCVSAAVIIGYQHLREAMERDLSEADIIANSIADKHLLLIERARHILRTIEDTEEVRSGRISELNVFLGKLVRKNVGFATILAADKEGRVLAAGVPFTPYVVGDREYFVETIRRKDFFVGSYIVSRSTGHPSLPFALPVLDAEGEVRLVLIAALKLPDIPAMISMPSLPNGASVEIFDRSGRRLYRFPLPDEDEEVRITISDAEREGGEKPRMANLLIPGNVPEIVKTRGISGGSGSEENLRLVLRYPTASAVSAARGILLKTLLFIVASVLVSLVTAFGLLSRSITSRLSRLVTEVESAGKGMNTGEIPGAERKDEIGILARSFSEAMRSLRERDDERERTQAALRTSFEEQNVLLKEIHHRVKNNLQIISSLLNLQSMSVADSSSLTVLETSKNRIHALALIHELLYLSESFSRIDFREYVRLLSGDLFLGFEGMSGRVEREYDLEDQARFDLDTAIPLGLILNEIVSNSLEHAFPEGRKGKLTISLRGRGPNAYRLRVSDDGVGFPLERKGKGLGLELISLLAGQMGGFLSFEHNLPGTAVLLDFTVRPAD